MSTDSRDLQQRDFDAGGFEVLRIADPTTPNSATKVGTAIASVGPANAPGTSFKAAAEDHVHAGVAAVLPGDGIAVSPPDVQGRVTVSRAPGATDAVSATLDTEAEKSVTGTAEQVLAEWNFDFDDLREPTSSRPCRGSSPPTPRPPARSTFASAERSEPSMVTCAQRSPRRPSPTRNRPTPEPPFRSRPVRPS
jgi:hypothetical protein